MKRYNNRDELMTGLATQVAGELSAAIDANGRAVLSVPGGTTPAPFFAKLSMIDLPWDQVTIMLGDERLVDETSERSNTRLVRQNLLVNNASSANLLSIFQADANGELDIDAARSAVNTALPIDVLVVGMGADMHTASLFPDSSDLADALANDAPPLMVINAPSQPEARISLTAPVLRAATHKHLLITGAAKLSPLETAQNADTENTAPIRIVIAGDNPATIHYAE